MITRRAVKRYGVNQYGADPNWIEDVRVIKKGETPPSGFEEVLKVDEYESLIKYQSPAINAWKLENSTKDILLIDNSWSDNFTDYNQARKELKAKVVEAGGFSALSYSEQFVAAKWFAVNDDEIDTIFSLTEKLKNAVFFGTESMNSRKNRYGAVYIFVRNVLSRDELNNIADDMDSYGFVSSYVSRGREGTVSVNYQGDSDPEGLYDYILGTVGTSFENINMISRINAPKYGLTPQDVVNKVYDIFENGNY